MSVVRWYTSTGWSLVLSSSVLQAGPADAAELTLISLAQAKAHLKIPTAVTTEDANLTRWIKLARTSVEDETGIALLSQTWDLYLEAWGDAVPGAIELPRWPLQSITHVVTLNDAGAIDTTIATSTYWADTVRRPPRIVFEENAALSATTRAYSPIRIRYLAGYADVATIPPALIQAMYLYLADFHLHRGDERETTPTKPAGVQALLDRYILPGVA